MYRYTPNVWLFHHVGRKGECMKVESTALSEQRETNATRRKTEQTHTLNFPSLFGFFSNMCCSLVLSIRVRICCVRLLFTPQSKIGTDFFFCLSLHLPGKCSTDCSYPLMSSSQLFQAETSPYFHLRETSHFLVVPHLHRKFWTSAFFSAVNFN